MGKWIDRLQVEMMERAPEELPKLTKGACGSNGSDFLAHPPDFLPTVDAVVPTPAFTIAARRTRLYRLAKPDADAAHAVAWDDAAIERFTLRVGTFVLAGFHGDDADDLAERLHLRDVEIDDRRACIECQYRRGMRCDNATAAGLGSPVIGSDEVVRLRRCVGFAPSVA